jgi:membrane protease YdiL (CAAX protease family)
MNLLRGRPILSYFTLTFAISWFGAFLVAAPHLLRGEPIPKFAGLMMFPAMLLGPSFTGIFLTRVIDGPAGLRDLFVRMRRVLFPPQWYGALLIPPIFVMTVLFLLRTFVSPDYSPNHFYIGAGFGIAAGFFEEIGWTGFAFPKLHARFPLLPAATILGLLWGCWHIPVIDYLGTATPHGPYWLHFFLAFTAAMTAMRVLISWIYSQTKSVLLAQLLHACSTGALVVFSPPHIIGAQEAFWYAIYAAALWLLIATLALTRPHEFLSSSES